MEEFKQLLKSFLGIMLVVAVSFLIGARYGRKTARIPVRLEVIKDTTEITVYKEKIVEKPVPKLIYKDRTDTMWLPSPHGDSSLVEVPIESKVYAEDSLYYARISGFRCSLDTLKIYPTITTITIREKERIPAPRWSFGVTAGPSILATPKGQVHAGLGATVGLQYRF